MNKREDLESALAQAEAARERLEAALAEAKAALVNTVTDAAKIDANQAEASAKVEKARERCRQLRAALMESSRPQFITRSRERVDPVINQSDDLSKPETAASAPPIRPRKIAVRGRNGTAQDQSQRRKPLDRLSNALATSPRLREAIGLLALVLAYLQYYYFEVQLEILSLPSVFPGPLG